MPAILSIYDLGKSGVVVDKAPIRNDVDGTTLALYGPNSPTELLQAQNAINDPLGAFGGIRNRPGLLQFTGMAAGTVLGGIGVPLQNLSPSAANIGVGGIYFYIGRGPVT